MVASEVREIMVVEDEMVVRMSIVDYMEDSGYKVREVTHPGEALESLGMAPCDAVICDYRMADMNGLEFLDVMQREHPAIPVIIFTGMADDSLARELMAHGAASCLFKPLPSMKVLVETVEKALGAVT